MMVSARSDSIKLNLCPSATDGPPQEEYPGLRDSSPPREDGPLDAQADDQAPSDGARLSSKHGVAVSEPSPMVSDNPDARHRARSAALQLLENWSREDLYALCKEQGLKGLGTKRKCNMVDALTAHFGQDPALDLPTRLLSVFSAPPSTPADGAVISAAAASVPAGEATLMLASCASAAIRALASHPPAGFPNTAAEDSDVGPPSEDEDDDLRDQVDETLPVPVDPSARNWEQVSADHPPMTLNAIATDVPETDAGRPRHSIVPLISDKKSVASALKAFELFITPSMLDYISKETRINANLKQSDVRSDQPTQTHTREWTADMCSSRNLMLWIGVTLHMSLATRPTLSHYWSTDRLWQFDMTGKSGMTQEHYEQILRYLHFNDNAKWKAKGQPGYDPLFKVRPLFNMFSENLQGPWSMGRCVSVDEMIKFKGRLSFVQCMPIKPIKRGLKVFAAWCSKTGYVWSILPYTGKQEDYSGDAVGDLGRHVTNYLLRGLTETWRHVYADDFFVTVPLCEDLLQKNTYLTGTTRPNRIGFPAEARVLRCDPPGTVRVHRSGSGVTAAGIVDKRPFHMLSTRHSGVELMTRDRMQHDGTSSADELLALQDDYRQRMGGVDHADARMGLYHSQGKVVGHWYLHYFFWMIEAAALNAYCIWSAVRKERAARGRRGSSAGDTYLLFKEQLIKEIYLKYRGPAGGESGGPPRPRAGKKKSAPGPPDDDDDDGDSNVSGDYATPVTRAPKRSRTANESTEVKPIHRQAAADIRMFDGKKYHALWRAGDLPGRKGLAARGLCIECKNQNAKTATMCGTCYVYVHCNTCHAEHIRKALEEAKEE